MTLFKNEIKSKTNTLPKNITLQNCPTIHSDGNNNNGSGSPRLVVIFAWLSAEDKHLNKYRELWFKRGFNVLIVRTSSANLLLPSIGSQIVAKNLLKVLLELKPNYTDIVVHAFSVGGYQFGEVLVHLLEKSTENDLSLIQSIKGLVMDSIVAANDSPSGLSKTMTNNPKLQTTIEKIMKLYFKIFYNITHRHFINSQNMIYETPLKCAGLIFYSKDDIFSDFQNIEKLIQIWNQRGNQIQVKCWDQSSHVLHYKHHQKEYEQELDYYLKNLNLESS